MRWLTMLLMAMLLPFNVLAADYTVGVAAFDHPQQVQQRWQATIDHLNQHSGALQFQLLALPLPELERRLEAGEIDFVIQNSVKSVQYKERFGASQLLTARPLWSASAQQAIGSALVGRRDRPIDDWQQLRSLRAVSVSPQAFGGYIALWPELSQRGAEPMQFFKQLQFVGTPQRQLLKLLLAGDADVAILPSCLLESMQQQGVSGSEQLQVLLDQRPAGFPCGVSSRLYPYFMLSKLGHVPNEDATVVVRALLQLDKQQRASQQGQYSQWTVPVDDRAVYQLLRETQQWPFAPDWRTLFWRLLPWLLLAALILFLGYLHHRRVQAQVAKRTKQLRDEMAEHQQTQARLQEQQQAFYQAQRVLLTGEMAAGMAHELSQPLTSIGYLVQGCRSQLQRGNQQQLDQGLARIASQSDKASQLIHKFRHFAAQRGSHRPLQPQELVLETLELMVADLKRHQCRCQLANQLTEPLTIVGDPLLLQQVLVNLLRNAIDAMAEMAPAQRLISLRLWQQQGRLHLSVADNGHGLTPEALARLFQPFGSSKAQGLGLGMMICKRIIDQHQGQISAIALEQGLRIELNLPLQGTNQ